MPLMSIPSLMTMPTDFFNEGPEPLAPLTDEAVKTVRVALSIDFPTSYLSFLRHRNGGYIKYNLHPTDEPRRRGLRGSPVPVRGIAGIANGSRSYDIVELTADMKGWGVDTGRFVALDGEGHYWICFDKQQLNDDGEPTIAYVSSESGGAGPIAHCTIASSFEAFVQGLQRDDD